MGAPGVGVLLRCRGHASVGVGLVVLLLSAHHVCTQACLRKSEESLGIGSLNLSSNFYVTQPPFFPFLFFFLETGSDN